MKKVISVVGLAALIGVGSAQAAAVYKADNFQYTLNADWQIQLQQDAGTDQDMDVEYDDLELKNSAVYDLGNGLTAFGRVDFGAKGAADNSSVSSMSFEEAHVGMGYENFKFLIGKMDNAVDGFGVAQDIEISWETCAFGEFGEKSGDDILMFKADGLGGMVNLIASYELEASSESSDANGEDVALLATLNVSGITFGVAYQNYDAADITTEEGAIIVTDDVDIYGVSASYSNDMVTVGVDYSEGDGAGNVWNVAAAIPLKPVDLSGGLTGIEYDDDSEDFLGWYVGARYTFPETQFSLFAEVEGTDEDDTDPGFVLGMRLRF